MTIITISKKVIVPEKDVRDTIEACKKWFELNPDRNICNMSCFGHHSWQVNKKSIEADIKKAASLAKPYTKA